MIANDDVVATREEVGARRSPNQRVAITTGNIEARLITQEVIKAGYTGQIPTCRMSEVHTSEVATLKTASRQKANSNRGGRGRAQGIISNSGIF